MFAQCWHSSRCLVCKLVAKLVISYPGCDWLVVKLVVSFQIVAWIIAWSIFAGAITGAYISAVCFLPIHLAPGVCVCCFASSTCPEVVSSLCSIRLRSGHESPLSLLQRCSWLSGPSNSAGTVLGSALPSALASSPSVKVARISSQFASSAVRRLQLASRLLVLSVRKCRLTENCHRALCG